MLEVRERIIRSAIKLFARKGFFETTVEDIARGARVAKGTIYLYFKDKPSIYTTIIERHLQESIQSLREIEMQKISHREKVVEIIKRGIKIWLKFKNAHPMFSIENINFAKKLMRGIKPLFMKYHAEIIERIAEIVKAGIRTGEFKNVNPAVAAVYIINIIRTAILLPQINPDLKNYEQDIEKIFLEGLIRR